MGIEKLCANKHLDAIKVTTPLSFITSKEIDLKEMPPVSSDPRIIMGGTCLTYVR